MKFELLGCEKARIAAGRLKQTTSSDMITRTLKLLDGTEAGATYSQCERYRYRLWRTWGDPARGVVNFLMLSPSTATEHVTDPTVERCLRRARAMGFSGLVVTNLFAFRATDPLEMMAQLDPVGLGNDAAILEAAAEASMVVCAWGNMGYHRGRARDVLRMLVKEHKGKLHALKVSQSGHPWHPLYVAYECKPVPFGRE